MIQKEFKANFISFEFEDSVYTLGLSDDQFDPECYIIIQAGGEITEQDIETETDKEYVETSFFEGGRYNILRRININQNLIVFYLEVENIEYEIHAVNFDTPLLSKDLTIFLKKMFESSEIGILIEGSDSSGN